MKVAVKAVLVVGACIVIALTLSAYYAIRYARSGPCVLRARAAIVGQDAPLLTELNKQSDVLILRNDNMGDWQDVEVAIYGLRTGSVRPGQPTGKHTHRLGKIYANSFEALELSHFQNAEGKYWIPLMMQAEDVEVKATMRGVACRTEDLKLIH